MQVGGQRKRGGGPQLGRGVVPHDVQELVGVAQTPVQGAQQPALAVFAVGQILVQLGPGVGDGGPVAGAQHLEIQLAQAP